ncbi:amylosucrase [Salinispira pacifica]|uniref:Sucrose phosphorylase n=1 Tax=Salinispira pacifica TaxID=1307761 RepID=V5WKX3_9SPIO|nr:amylosucrase [Salinispira pacifica]AHC16295.1 Sucrose phosphorylase [Salinispira pacifica]
MNGRKKDTSSGTVQQATGGSEAVQALGLLRERLAHQLKSLKGTRRLLLEKNLDIHFPDLFQAMRELYGSRWDFFYQLETLIGSLIESVSERPEDLIRLDASRIEEPHWYENQRMVGAMLYVDRFAGDLQQVKSHIPYLKKLGITYLHLMPLFKAPEGESDGGYAISSYRKVDSRLGTMEDLEELSAALRKEGISLVLDFVFNHTSDEHDWAMAARQGDPSREEFYFVLRDRDEMEEYNAHLRDIFPDVRKGSFTWNDELAGWVWTTFNSFQWDLNYGNPGVFRAMVEEMLFIANRGTEVLRLDALAFVWKEKGTVSENLPKAHTLISMFRSAARIAAPAMVFKSEAIVHPDEVAKYISPRECELSYNPMLMALLWESLATRKTDLLQHSLQKRFQIPQACSWVNYVRSHDDIGWTFADEDARELGINGNDHRGFLNDFYTARFPGSFARGVPFQLNPATGDCRISGSCASLSGIEQGLEELRAGDQEGDQSERHLEEGIRRHLLIHGIIISISGIPLIYMGDEFAQLNWYDYQNDQNFSQDSRWIHRPPFDWDRINSLMKNTEKAADQGYAARIFEQLGKMIGIRKEHPAFGESRTTVLGVENPHILAYMVGNASEQILVVSNFNEWTEEIQSNHMRLQGVWPKVVDLLTGDRYDLGENSTLKIPPLSQLWLSKLR